MNSLEITLQDCFRGYGSCHHYGQNTRLPIEGRKAVQMVIPIKDDQIFEIPTFALCDIGQTQDFLESDALVMNLERVGTKPRYKSLDARIRDGFSIDFKTCKLWCLGLEGDPERMYYITQGAIFDWNLNPIMMLTWQVEMRHEENGPTTLNLVKPVMRIAPHLFVSKIDVVQRYICGKMLTTVLGMGSLYRLWISGCPSWLNIGDGPYRVKVEIDYMPFQLKAVNVPSVSTTSYELRNIALDHMEEVAT